MSDEASCENDSSKSSSDRQLISGLCLAILGTTLFALKSIFIKLAFATDAGAIHLLTIRMVFSLPFYVFVLHRVTAHGDASLRTILRSLIARALMLGFLGYYLASMLDFAGLQHITAQLERLTLFTYPAMIAVLAWLFLGEPLGPRIIGAIGLSYAGVVLMYGQERATTQSSNIGWGVALVLCSAVSYSLYVLFAKPTMQQIGSRLFTSLAMIGSTCFVVIHCVCVSSVAEFWNAKPIVYVYGLALAFVCTVLPSFMINEAILRIGATRTTVVGSIGPVVTMGLAMLVLNEPSSLQHFTGMGIAIAGVSLVVKPKAMTAATANSASGDG